MHSDKGSQFQLAGLLEGPSRGTQHESARELPRQCCSGEFLPATEAGAYQAKSLSLLRSSSAGHLRLYGDVLQPEVPAWFRKWAIADSVCLEKADRFTGHGFAIFMASVVALRPS